MTRCQETCSRCEEAIAARRPPNSDAEGILGKTSSDYRVPPEVNRRLILNPNPSFDGWDELDGLVALYREIVDALRNMDGDLRAIEVSVRYGIENPQANMQESAAVVAAKGPAAKTWPDPEEHTAMKVWTTRDGELRISTKTHGERDGRVDFQRGSKQSVLVMLLAHKHARGASLKEALQTAYRDEFKKNKDNPRALKKLMAKLRALISDIRKKLERAGVNPDMLTPIDRDVSPDTRVRFRTAMIRNMDAVHRVFRGHKPISAGLVARRAACRTREAASRALTRIAHPGMIWCHTARSREPL